MPTQPNTIVKGLMEPYAKRTVEGDIGMRYSIWGIVDAAGIDRVSQLSGIAPERAKEMIQFLSENTETLPKDQEWENLDFALASLAVETAVIRHAGTIEQVYTPMGACLLSDRQGFGRLSAALSSPEEQSSIQSAPVKLHRTACETLANPVLCVRPMQNFCRSKIYSGCNGAVGTILPGHCPSHYEKRTDGSNRIIIWR